MQARRENAAYSKLVETGKKLDKIEERKRKRMEKEKRDGHVKTLEEKSNSNKRRKPRQTKPLQEGTDKATNKALLGSLVA